MKKLSPLIILSLLLLSGCGVFGGGGSDNQANISPTPPQQPTPDGENQQENPEETVIEENMGSANSVPNALIPSTNPKERLNQISQGRGNPFGSIRPPAVVKVSASQPVPPSAVAKAILREPTATNSLTGSNSSALVNNNRQSGNVINKKSSSSQEMNNLCEIPSPEMMVRAPKIGVSGVVTGTSVNAALITLEDEPVVRTVREGDVIYSGANTLLVKQINSYNLLHQVASNSRSLDLSGGTLSGDVVFELEDGSFIVKRVGEKVGENTEQNTQAFQLNLKKEQFNIVNREIDGITLIALEDIVPRLVTIGDSNEPQAPKQVIEISGYVCNNTNKTIQVTEMTFALSSGNTELPPLTGFFQGLEQGDISTIANTTRQPRLIRPGMVTLFRGTVANVPAFQTQDKIDLSFEQWR